MLNFGVFSDGLPEKKLKLVDMSILINPIKTWAGMSHIPPDELVQVLYTSRSPRKSIPWNTPR
jgi:hypothetical protein